MNEVIPLSSLLRKNLFLLAWLGFIRFQLSDVLLWQEASKLGFVDRDFPLQPDAKRSTNVCGTVRLQMRYSPPTSASLTIPFQESMKCFEHLTRTCMEHAFKYSMDSLFGPEEAELMLRRFELIFGIPPVRELVNFSLAYSLLRSLFVGREENSCFFFPGCRYFEFLRFHSHLALFELF